MVTLDGNTDNNKNQDLMISPKIAETDLRFVGKGMDLVNRDITIYFRSHVYLLGPLMSYYS